MSQGERRLAAVMFTDMVGYTALGQENETLSLALVDEQRKLIRPILNRHSGREVKTMGDSFLVVFSSALEAVRCAYDIQRAIREFNFSLPEERRVSLRVGIHLGDVLESMGDVSGDAVNVASRIEPLAEGGGVCLTRQVYDHVQNKFELSLVSLGTKPLKNVNTPVEVYKMVMPWHEETSTSVRLEANKIAVLPFVNMSTDPNDMYFADGITEEIISTLSNVSGLSVISRTSVMGYKGTTKKLRDIGRELEVGSVLEGSFRKAGNKMRITTQLIKVPDDIHLWAQSYDRELEDVFVVQSDIAKQVANAISVRILPHEKERIEKAPTGSTAAYSLYLKGRHYWDERNEEAIRKAIQYFRQAVEVDPNYALGYAGLADSHLILAHNSLGDLKTNYLAAKEFVLKALELDSDLAEAHATLSGILGGLEYDHRRAEEEITRAISLKPNYATAHQWYSMDLLQRCRWAEAYEETRKAIELDPLSLMINTNLGGYFVSRGDLDKAIEQERKVLEMDPNFLPAHYALFFIHLRKAAFKEALQEDEVITRLEVGKFPLKHTLRLANIEARKEEKENCLKLLSEVEERRKEEFISPFTIGVTYAIIGNKQKCLEWLEKGADEHDPGLNFLRIEPFLESIRSEDRYGSLLKKVGLS